MKRVVELLHAKKPTLARKVYVKMRAECLMIDGRKTGDKVCQFEVPPKKPSKSYHEHGALDRELPLLVPQC